MPKKSIELPEDLSEQVAPDLVHGSIEVAPCESKKATLKKLYKSGIYPYEKPMRRKEYEENKAQLQAELMKALKNSMI